MITIENTESKPVLWPGGSLAGLGKNPYGDPVWRVVWSTSRTFLVGGRHLNRAVDGEVLSEFVGYRHVPMYLGKDCYILERWLSAFQFAKCSPEMWEVQNRDPDTGLNRLGPYPEKGEYYGPCHEFDGYPTLGAVEAQIRLITYCEALPRAEKMILEMKARETERVMQLNRARDTILEALPLSMTTGCLSPLAMHNAEKIPDRLTAQDIAKLNHMPIGQNKAFTMGAERT